MASPISYIGSTVSISVAKPATTDAAGFLALGWTAIGKTLSWGELGDTSNDISVDLLEGRVEHVNGAKDGGEVSFAFRSDNDAGQTLLKNNNNNNVDVSLRFVDPDGEIAYLFGKVANMKDNERSSSSFKGQTGVIRVNSPTIRV